MAQDKLGLNLPISDLLLKNAKQDLKCSSRILISELPINLSINQSASDPHIVQVLRKYTFIAQPVKYFYSDLFWFIIKLAMALWTLRLWIYLAVQFSTYLDKSRIYSGIMKKKHQVIFNPFVTCCHK